MNCTCATHPDDCPNELNARISELEKENAAEREVRSSLLRRIEMLEKENAACRRAVERRSEMLEQRNAELAEAKKVIADLPDPSGLDAAQFVVDDLRRQLADERALADQLCAAIELRPFDGSPTPQERAALEAYRKARGGA